VNEPRIHRTSGNWISHAGGSEAGTDADSVGKNSAGEGKLIWGLAGVNASSLKEQPAKGAHRDHIAEKTLI
jgi:hypothetical protein